MAGENRKDKKTLIIILVLAVLGSIIALVVNSLKRIDTWEVGISYDVHQKKLGDKIQTAGLHMGTPGFQFIKFPSVFKTIKFNKITCFNKEGVSIVIHEQFQYRARPKNLRDIIIRYKNHETYAKLLRSLALAAIHDSCSAFNVTQFQTQRAVFQEYVRTLTAQRFNNVSADLTDLQVSSIVRPASYETAVRNMESAEENIKLAKAQRPRLLITANTAKQEAITAAQITKQKADAEASVILAQADATAAGITSTFEAEATAYEAVLTNQNLTIEGLLSYMAVRAVAEKGKVSVNLKEPARTKYTHT
ncbi:uncharacterized protein LOC116297920 isoform X1 [Actinia tenebrosa]|uniref:Uncharacterized protein LOC116297920 isoform X1 n=1 Tax=Actinia tenebrosa TaxID=6105 RepID=A0A6P8IBE4_ACTTE|nr:uncharacterized protein LOC116297920 isoform X1 [Actinia tenebrosa]